MSFSQLHHHAVHSSVLSCCPFSHSVLSCCPIRCVTTLSNHLYYQAVHSADYDVQSAILSCCSVRVSVFYHAVQSAVTTVRSKVGHVTLRAGCAPVIVSLAFQSLRLAITQHSSRSRLAAVPRGAHCLCRTCRRGANLPERRGVTLARRYRRRGVTLSWRHGCRGITLSGRRGRGGITPSRNRHLQGGVILAGRSGWS